MLWILIGILLVLVFVNWLCKDEQFDKISGPKGIFLVENTLDFLMDPVKLFYFFRTLANKYKYLFKVKFRMMKCVVIYSPEDVEIVLSGSKNNRKGFLYKLIEPWLKEGLLLSDGLKWQERRKILMPAFHFNILRHFHSTLEDNNTKLINQLKMESDNQKSNLTAIITDYTLNSICETAMGIKLDPQGSDDRKRYKEGIYTLGQLLVYRSQRLWMYFDWIYMLTKTAKMQRKVLKLLQTFRDNVIENRRKTIDYQKLGQMLEMENKVETCDDNVYGKKRLAMLDLLLQAEKLGTIDAEGIGEEVDTFMFEGHDTTSTALQFILMSLANNPEVQEKAIKECDTIFGSSIHPATMNDLGQMKYIEFCIKESLRLYPPVHFFTRKLRHDTHLTNYTIPAGTDCTILVYDLHRRDDQFVDPLKFWPERFQVEPTWHSFSYVPFSAGPRNCIANYTIPAGTDCTILVYDLHRRDDQFVDPLKFWPERFQVEPTWHSFSYVPFSAGPRNCIGQKFAMMEMKLAVSAILRRYRLLAVTRPQDIIFITDFILRPRDPIYVKFQSRI